MHNAILVFLGGGMGAVVRYCLSVILPSKNGDFFPYATLCANFLGCFIASAVFTYFIAQSNINQSYKNFLIVGFCGGLSTLSAMSLEIMEYIQSGEYIRAGGYILTSLLICTISVILGVILVKKYV